MIEGLDYDKMVVIVIKALREYLGHSRKQLADALEIEEIEYEKAEAREVEISVGWVHAIAGIMGFNMLYLISITEAYDKFDIKNLSKDEIGERLNEIWLEIHKEIGIDKEGYDFFRTNLVPILLQIQKTQASFGL